MSTSAVLFLLAALTSLTVAVLLPLSTGAGSQVMGAAAVLFAALFLLALVRGRRFKFDPLLR